MILEALMGKPRKGAMTYRLSRLWVSGQKEGRGLGSMGEWVYKISGCVRGPGLKHKGHEGERKRMRLENTLETFSLTG